MYIPNNTFPRIFSKSAIAAYFVLLVVISMVFFRMMMPLRWILFGIVEVLGFFYFSNALPKRWAVYSPEVFKNRLFMTALIIRVVYVLFSYVFYWAMTGTNFDFEAADVLFYHDMGQIGHQLISEGRRDFFTAMAIAGGGMDLSDSGYPYYLSILYTLTGDSILITRLIKAVLSAYTCVLIYKFALRNFDDRTARLASIMCMLMPNLIYYCGIHLKETEMLFLLVLFVERTDYSFKGDKINWKALAVGMASALLLFLFRNALGVVCVLSLVCYIVLSRGSSLNKRKKIVLGVIMLIGLLSASGGRMLNESVELYSAGSSGQAGNMQWRSVRENGNAFAKYGNKYVFLPLIFTIPFPTMVNIEHQQNQQMIHGGNFVKNITSGITIYALFLLLLTGDWRRYVLPLAVFCGYLFVLASSNFAHSERFHLPALPFAMMFAAYGLTHLKPRAVNWFKYWLLFILAANVVWAWFKLAGRGMM